MKHCWLRDVINYSFYCRDLRFGRVLMNTYEYPDNIRLLCDLYGNSEKISPRACRKCHKMFELFELFDEM